MSPLYRLMLDAGGAVMRLVYDGRFGDDFSAHSGAIKASIPY